MNDRPHMTIRQPQRPLTALEADLASLLADILVADIRAERLVPLPFPTVRGSNGNVINGLHEEIEQDA